MADPYSFNSGNSFPITSWEREVIGEKSTVLALYLGFISPGLGITYAGNTGFGIALFIGYIACFILYWCTIWFLIGIIFIIPMLIILIYGMIKAYSMCNENNCLWREYLASR